MAWQPGYHPISSRSSQIILRPPPQPTLLFPQPSPSPPTQSLPPADPPLASPIGDPNGRAVPFNQFRGELIKGKLAVPIATLGDDCQPERPLFFSFPTNLNNFPLISHYTLTPNAETGPTLVIVCTQIGIAIIKRTLNVFFLFKVWSTTILSHLTVARPPSPLGGSSPSFLESQFRQPGSIGHRSAKTSRVQKNFNTSIESKNTAAYTVITSILIKLRIRLFPSHYTLFPRYINHITINKTHTKDKFKLYPRITCVPPITCISRCTASSVIDGPVAVPTRASAREKTQVTKGYRSNQGSSSEIRIKFGTRFAFHCSAVRSAPTARRVLSRLLPDIIRLVIEGRPLRGRFQTQRPPCYKQGGWASLSEGYQSQHPPKLKCLI